METGVSITLVRFETILIATATRQIVVEHIDVKPPLAEARSFHAHQLGHRSQTAEKTFIILRPPPDISATAG
jgi:hypothetical protein